MIMILNNLELSIMTAGIFYILLAIGDQYTCTGTADWSGLDAINLQKNHLFYYIIVSNPD